MAIKATIFKADLQIADLDRGYYADHSLTLAQQDSETDERLMMRVLAFALWADDQLVVARGMIDNEEPEMWIRNLHGDIEHWIDVGQPDPKWLTKASRRSGKVTLLTYGRSAPVWWNANKKDLERLGNLQVLHVPADESSELARMAQRGMKLQFTLQEGQTLVVDARGDSLTVSPQPIFVPRQ